MQSPYHNLHPDFFVPGRKPVGPVAQVPGDGSAGLWMIDEAAGDGVHDLVSNALHSSTDMVRGDDSYGRYIKFGSYGGLGGVKVPAYDATSWPGVTCVAVVQGHADISGYPGIISAVNAGDYIGNWNLSWEGRSILRWRAGSGSPYVQLSGISVGDIVAVVATWDLATLKLYTSVNGGPVTLQSIANIASFTGIAAENYIGHYSRSGGRSCRGPIYFAKIQPKAISADEALAIIVDQYADLISTLPDILPSVSGGGLTAVNTDLNLQWHTLASITSDIDLRWQIINAVETDLPLAWSLLTSTTNDLQLSWNALHALTADLDTRWDIESALTSVSVDLGLQWNTTSAVTSDIDLRWQILTAVDSDIQLTWDLLNSVTNDVQLAWDTLHALTANLDTRWSIIESISADLDLQWDIQSALASVAADLGLSWNVHQSITADLALQWDIRHAIVATLDTRWEILNAVGVDLDMRWHIATAVAADLALQWGALENISADADLRWNTLEATENGLTLQWSIGGLMLTPISFIAVPAEQRVIPVPHEQRVLPVYH